MLILDARKFAEIIHALFGSEMTIRNTRGPLPPQVQQTMQESRQVIMSVASAMGLSMTVKTADHMMDGLTDTQDLHRALIQVTNTFMLELEGRKYYGPLPDVADLYEQPELFGREVFTAFPSANDDIYEAGMCLALERSTACVMHLMRAHEVALKALAKAVGVTSQNDWGRYLSEIEKELDRRTKAAGARTPDEQFYAEAGANFDRLRRAYRNPTMHPDKSYSQGQAKDIMQATKAFMTHLATKVSE